MKSSVFVGIFLFSTAAEATERPTLGTLQEVVLPQIGRGRAFVRIAVAVSARMVERSRDQ